MATILRDVFPGPFMLPTANWAAPSLIAGTNFPILVLLFDASTEEAVYFPFRAHNYGSGNLSLDVDWYADTASSGDVVWGGSLAAITPNSDATDIEAKSFATETTVTDTHLGTTGQRLHRTTITISNLDALVAGDDCWIKLARKAASGSDTMTGDAAVPFVSLSYSDT